MLALGYTNLLRSVCFLVVLVGLGGCAGLDHYLPAPPPQLTSAQKDKVGEAVEEKLIQMLGGPYHDKALVDDLGRLGKRYLNSAQPYKFSVADKNTPAIYALPGQRAILTRGLLAEVRNSSELAALLTYAEQLSSNIYENQVTRSMSVATEELLSVPVSPYYPGSAAIRLARQFKEDSCVKDCLASAKNVGIVSSGADSGPLPESIKRLSSLQSGYELLAKAKDFEKDNIQGQAIATYLQAATTAPDEPGILGSLGLAYLRVGQLQPARLHLQKAVKVQPDYYRTRMGLGYLYLQKKDFRKANAALASSVRMLPVIENLFLLAESREKSGDVKGAASLYRLIVESDRHSKLGRTSASRLAESAGVQ